jgi:hypothetical protein
MRRCEAVLRPSASKAPRPAGSFIISLLGIRKEANAISDGAAAACLFRRRSFQQNGVSLNKMIGSPSPTVNVVVYPMPSQ